ncbi:MAG TPA: carboxypeptidase regulatory-like domain-containing protein, partial [Acidobacteriaceae bacterium]
MHLIHISHNKRRKTVLYWIGYLTLLPVLLCGSLHAQNTYGSAVGTITDHSGAVVGGASVKLTNVDTGDLRTATTNSNGDYQFLNLPPGNYKVDVENTGFKHFTRINVVVQVQGSTRVDAALELGNVSETVEVTSQAPLLETQQATIGQVVAGRAVSELPLNGRNVFNLLALSPGVVPQGGTQASNAVSGMNGNGFATGNYQISGGIPNTGAEFIDGGPINNGYINAIAYIPAQDSIQEFRIEANAIGPEFGGTTNGVVTMVTKSGTNAFHGTAYEFLRNTVLNANTFFSNQAHLKRPVLIQNQFGGTIGGPIKKDKLFFFGSYEGIRAAIGTTTTYSVPTAQMEAGVISSSTPILDPGQFNANGVFVPNPPGTTFPGNIIPANRINPTSKAMFQWWAPPNGLGTVNNYSVNATTHPVLNQYIARLDWNASEKQRIFGRYTYHHSLNPSALPYGYLPNRSTGHNAVHQVVLGDSITVSPTTILDVRLSYFRDTSFTGATGIPFNLGFTGWPAATIAQLGASCCGPVIPRVAVSGLSVNGGGGQQIYVTEENYAISGSATKILGRHTIRFGGEFRRAPNNYGQTNSTQVEAFGFTNAFTGNPWASYLLGLPQTTVTELAIIPASTTYYSGVYAGDSFQATNRLVLNFGLRWEYPGYWTERHDRQAVFLANETNPLAGPTHLPLQGNVELVNTPAYPHRTNLLPHYDLFSPRLGITYRLTHSFVVRSGFAILFSPTANIQQDAQPYQAPVNLAFTQINPTTQPINSFSNPFPGGVLQPVGRSSNYLSVIQGQPVVTNVPKEPSTYVEQWNLDIEKDLGHQVLVDVAYVGNHGVHQQLPAGLNDNGQGLDQIPDGYLSMGPALLTQVPNPFYGLITTGNLAGRTIPAGQLLRPYPQYFNLWNAANTAAGSNYNAMQAKVEKRFAQGGTLLGAYTWAKNMGTADTQTGFQEAVQPGEVQDWNNLQAEYGPLSYNVPQRFVAAYVYDLPLGKGKRFLGNQGGVVDKIVSGWGLDGITTYALGFPLIFTAQPTFISQQFGAGIPRPNVTPGCAKKLSGSAISRQHGWFNTSCFTQPSNYGFGNEPRTDTSLRTQGIANWDAALFKTTDINEKINVQFRAEGFNVFNRVQFGQPNTVCCSTSNASFGVVSTQLNLPRV